MRPAGARGAVPGIAAGRAQVVLFQPPVQRLAGDAQRIGGALQVALVAFDRPRDQPGLGLLQGHLVEILRQLRRRAEVEGGSVDLVALGQQCGTLHQVLQLAHVARPAPGQQRALCGGRQTQAVSAVAPRVA
jgi:hypothetical protein